ncbi:MAG: flagellar hook-basal body complex protein FliE [Intestinimonas sp.]|jgi:flagellar hook-basal body complex protein FliE|nr:flagellar hook-basal body complex protein FliE [Intestinimonas sp.]
MNTTPFEGIQPLWNALSAGTQQSEAGSAGTNGVGMFADIYQNAIDNVKTTDAEKNKAEYLLATGQLDNPAELTVASTKAQLAVDLLVQLRNKALDTYSELTRISL